MVRVRVQFPVVPRRTALARQLRVGAVGTAVTALLVQLAFEPPGPSMVAVKFVAVLVAQFAVPAQLFALQLPAAAGAMTGCLVESITPDPVSASAHDAVVPCLEADNIQPGGVNFATDAVQVAVPLGPTTVAINSASLVWLHLIVLLAGVFPFQFTELPAIEKLETVPVPDVLVRV